MSVDMFERRFRQELAALPEFKRVSSHDPVVREVGFPAWRGLFTEMCLYGHCTGYRLFSFDSFYERCKRAYSKAHHPDKDFHIYFEGPREAGMRHRIAVWYESGMAETYLYACLVEMIEDKSHSGLVLYDPRADWKLKADLVVLIGDRAARVSAMTHELVSRPRIEAARELTEHVRKQNTSESAGWDNEQLKRLAVFQITTDGAGNSQIVNGLRLFSLAAVNRLLRELYDFGGVQAERRFVFREP
jgi:hypothetical protein